MHMSNMFMPDGVSVMMGFIYLLLVTVSFGATSET
jgi:hypothetical protein